jgi:hypothetical protein
MFNKNRKMDLLIKNIDKLNLLLESSNIIEILYVLGKRSEIIKRNLLAGIFRGVGIGIGVTVISAVIILFLQRIVRLNLPIIGEYITDIVEIVQKNM